MKPRVLLLTHRVPYPPDRGDRIRCWQLLQHLAAHANMSLAALADEPVSPATESILSELCEQICFVRLGRWSKVGGAITALASGTSVSQQAFTSSRLAKTVDNWHRQRPFDAAVVYCSSMFGYVKSWREVPKLVDLIDVDSAKWKSYAGDAGAPLNWLYRREARLVARLERDIVDSSAEVVLTTQRETELLREDCPHATPLVVTNGVDTEYFQSQQSPTPGRVVFTGVLNYHPNVQGMLWFAKHVWPRLIQQSPDMTLDIVGRSPTAPILALHNQSGITVSPNVPDVRRHLTQAELVIAPLHIARGIQNKALEAMSMQRPVIVSPAVGAGLSATPGEHFVVADSADEWIEQMTDLHRDSQRRQHLAAGARAYVEEHHAWSNCLQPICDWLTRVTEGSSRTRVASLAGI